MSAHPEAAHGHEQPAAKQEAGHEQKGIWEGIKMIARSVRDEIMTYIRPIIQVVKDTFWADEHGHDAHDSGHAAPAAGHGPAPAHAH